MHLGNTGQNKVKWFFIVGFCQTLKLPMVPNLWEVLDLYLKTETFLFFFFSIHEELWKLFCVGAYFGKAPMEPKGKSLYRTFLSCWILSSWFLLCCSEKSGGIVLVNQIPRDEQKADLLGVNFASLSLCLALIPFLEGMNFPFLKLNRLL